MSSGERGFGEAKQLGKVTGETQTCCSAKGRLSRGSTFLQHPLQTPYISPQRCHASSAGRSAANRIFSPPVLRLNGSLQHAVKPFIGKEGKGFTRVFTVSLGNRENLPRHTQFWAANVISGSGAESGSIRVPHGARIPNPSSRPRSHMPLGHGTLRNSLSAERQRRLLQKQNKIEYKEEQQRVCRANCCSGETPSWRRAAPTGSVPDLPPSCHPTRSWISFSDAAEARNTVRTTVLLVWGERRAEEEGTASAGL